MDSFYMTLPSNVKSKTYNNTVANFKTKVSQRISLSGDWEVALVDASYTYSWYNLPNKENIKLLTFQNGVIKEFTEEVEVVPSRYDTIEELLKYINESLNAKFLKYSQILVPEFKNNKLLRRVYIDRNHLHNYIIFPRISSGLCKLFGIDKSKMDKESEIKLLDYSEETKTLTTDQKAVFRPIQVPGERELRYWSDKPYDFAIGLHSLYVYCDIIKHNFVGDSYTQLLRIVEVPPKSKFGDQIVLTYSSPHYIPVLFNDFESIEIDIKDDTGEQIPFQFGRSIFVLHFRKVNKSN